jgi:hypothetical protein
MDLLEEIYVIVRGEVELLVERVSGMSGWGCA